MSVEPVRWRIVRTLSSPTRSAAMARKRSTINGSQRSGM